MFATAFGSENTLVEAQIVDLVRRMGSISRRREQIGKKIIAMRKKGNDTNEHELSLLDLKVELRVLRRRRHLLRRAYLANLTVQEA